MTLVALLPEIGQLDNRQIATRADETGTLQSRQWVDAWIAEHPRRAARRRAAVPGHPWELAMQRFSHQGIRPAPAQKGKTIHRRQHAHSKELLVEFENEPSPSAPLNREMVATNSPEIFNRIFSIE
jgi:hypothetical protein